MTNQSRLGVFLSISYGISGAINALIISLQPIIVTVLVLNFFKEKITTRVWFGLALGFLGVFFVVISKLNLEDFSMLGIFCSFIALAGLSFGSLYQKKYCSNMNLYSGGAIQTLISIILVLPFFIF